MSTSCSCLKLCSLLVALANMGLGVYILINGAFAIQDYLSTKDVTIGLIIVYFQMSSFLIFAGLLLLIGIIKVNEQHIALYLLLGSLIWFIITMLAVSYMLFYNTTTTQQSVVQIEESTTIAPLPKQAVPLEKAVGFSVGLVLIWCGQLSVYKFHDQVIEKNVINAGVSYVSSAIRSV